MLEVKQFGTEIRAFLCSMDYVFTVVWRCYEFGKWN